MTKDVKVCWVTGNYTQRSQLIDNIKDSIGECEYFHFNEDSALTFAIEQISTYSPFEDKKLVILNGWPTYKGTKQTAAKKLLKALERLDDKSLVILNNLKFDSQSFTKSIEKIGRVKRFPESFELSDAARVVGELFEQKQITTDECATLASSLAPPWGEKTVDADALFLLIKKLDHFVGDRKVIKDVDVRAVCVDNFEFVVWQLLNLLDKKDCHGAFALFSQVVDNSNNLRNDAENILRTMIWRYRLLMLIKESNIKHTSKDALIDNIEKLPKIQRVKSTIRSNMGFFTRTEKVLKDGKDVPLYTNRVIQMGIAPSAVYDRKTLLSIYKAIVDSFLKVRSTDSDAQIMTCFESLLMLICGKTTLKASNFLREEFRYI